MWPINSRTWHSDLTFPLWPHLAILLKQRHNSRLLSEGRTSLTTNSTYSLKIKFMKPQIIILPMITIPCSWRRKIFVTQVQFNNGSECSYNDHFNSVPDEHVRLNSALNGKHSWSTLLSWRGGRSWQARAWARRWVEGDEKDQRDDPDSRVWALVAAVCAIKFQPRQVHDVFAEQHSAFPRLSVWPGDAGLAHPSPQWVFLFSFFFTAHLISSGSGFHDHGLNAQSPKSGLSSSSFQWKFFPSLVRWNRTCNCAQHSETNKVSIKHQSINIMGTCISIRLTKVPIKAFNLHYNKNHALV